MTSGSQGEDTDRELIERWKAGDSRAATALVGRHADALARFAVSTGERSEIEELVQNHIREVTEMIARVPGWSFSTFVTDQPLHEALLPLYGIPVKPSAPGANR